MVNDVIRRRKRPAEAAAQQGARAAVAVAAVVGELDRAMGRVLLALVAEATGPEGSEPTRAEVARMLGRPRAASGGSGRARSYGGLFGAVHALDLIDALARLEAVGLIERVVPGGGRIRLTPAGDEYLRGRSERPCGVLRALHPAPMDEDPVYAALRAMRSALANAEGLSPGYVLPNRVLRAIARTRPETIDALRLVPGIGDVKAKRYGGPILEVLKAAGGPVRGAPEGEKRAWDAHGWTDRDFGIGAGRGREEAPAPDIDWVR